MPFPHFYQLDAMDCGPTSLRIVAAHYGASLSGEAVLDLTGVKAGSEALLQSEFTWQLHNERIDRYN